MPRSVSSLSLFSQSRRPDHQGVNVTRHWHPSAEDDVGWWSVTFSDLVLLLFCFFVLWHIADKQRAVTATRAVQSPPLQAIDTAAPAETPAVFQSPSSDETIVASVSSALPQAELSALLVPMRQNPPEAEPPSDLRWQEMKTTLDRYVQEHELDRAVGVVSTEHGLVISLNDTITFPSGQATLTPTVAPILARVATLVAESPDLSLEISGHTDDRPITTAEFPSNWELSAARASRVARALLEQGRIDPTRISTRGYAHYHPLSPNDSDVHRAANRRVEISLFRPIEIAERTFGEQ